MSRSSKSTSPGNWILPSLSLLLLASLLGVFLAVAEGSATLAERIQVGTVGVVWAFILLQWVDMIGQALALQSNPIPADLDLSDREAVRSAAHDLKAGPEVNRRIQSLFGTWTESSNSALLLDLADFQSSRTRKPILAGTVFGGILLYASGLSEASSMALWGAAVLLGVTILAKIGLLSKIDSYIEARLLSRLPGHLPNTAMTVTDLASAIGTAIDQAFKQYVPQPEQMASSIQSGIEEAGRQIEAQGNVVVKALEEVKTGFMKAGGGLREETKESGAGMVKAMQGIQAAFIQAGEGLCKGVNESGEGMIKSMQELQADMIKAIQASQSETVQAMQEIKSGLVSMMQESGSGLGSSFSETGGRLLEKLNELSSGISSSLSGITQKNVEEMTALQTTMQSTLSGAGKEAVDRLTVALSEQSERLQSTSQSLVSQIEKLTEVEKNIENLLSVQKSVDHTIQAVSSSQEFKDTLVALRTHLQASDRLLKEASKPRMITLVEEDS